MQGVKCKPIAGIDITEHIICSFHPSQQNTFTGRLTEEMLDDVFIRARELGGLEPF